MSCGDGHRYIFDLFDSEVGVCGYADFFWLHVYDDEERVGCVALEELVDLEI